MTARGVPSCLGERQQEGIPLSCPGWRGTLSCPGWGQGPLSCPREGYSLDSNRDRTYNRTSDRTRGYPHPQKGHGTRDQGRNPVPEAIGTLPPPPNRHTHVKIITSRRTTYAGGNYVQEESQKQQNTIQEELKSDIVWNKFLHCLI